MCDLKKIMTLFCTVILTIGIFGSGFLISADVVNASGDDSNKAYTGSNKVTIPKSIKRGVFTTIDVSGHRYSSIKDKYDLYLRGLGGLDLFTDGEEFFQPEKINIKSIKKDGAKYNKSFYYTTYNTKLTREVFGVKLRLSAGKYKMTTTYGKRAVYLPPGKSTVNFVSKDKKVYTRTDTFFVQSKVKFNYYKKFAKLSKKQRTKYQKPGNKYGKLPKPKAKKGYKFMGWYTKSKGGKKISKATKVPYRDDIILYARYKRV